jgi:hypothetical protein
MDASIFLHEAFGKIDSYRAAYTIANAIEVALGDYIDRGPASLA